MTSVSVALTLGIMSLVGVLVVGYWQRQGQRAVATGDRLDLALQTQDKQMNRLEKQVEDLMTRASNAESRANHLEAELADCKRTGHQLELQIEVLKLRQGEGQ